MGFSHTQLTIREGESATAQLFIMSSELVAVTLSGDVAHALSQLTTAESKICFSSMEPTHTLCVLVNNGSFVCTYSHTLGHTHTHTYTHRVVSAMQRILLHQEPNPSLGFTPEIR